PERGAFSGSAIDVNFAPALHDNPVDSRQPQTRPLVFFFCGVIRLKKMVQRMLVHAAAGIGDLKHGVRTGLQIYSSVLTFRIDLYVGGADGYFSPTGHRIPRVDYQVHKNLLDMSLIKLNGK